MISSIALFPKSMDPEKIEELLSKQVASMKAAKGLQALKVSDGHLMSPGGPPAYSKVLESSWDSLENFMAWVEAQKPEDQSDKKFLLESGAVLLFYEVKEL
jgi:heme-degrading monooxygenase HmoA